MYISEKDALRYASRLILILVPFFSAVFSTWSWVIEILLLCAVFIHSHSSPLRFTVALLGVGYLVSFIPGGTGLTEFGFTPWAGVLLLWLKEKGLTTGHSIFWSMMLAALLSALPTIPLLSQILQPENMQQRIQSALQFYEQQGTLSAVERQGMNRLEFEKYLNAAIPVYYRLLPAFAGILGMIEIGFVYWAYRFFLRKVMKMAPFLIFRLPWYTVWVAIMGVASYLGGDYLRIESLKITGMNVMMISAALSLVIGLSCLAYLLRHPKFPKLVLILIVISIIIFPSFVFITLLMIGLFDPVFNFRRIPEKNEGVKQ